MTRYEQVVDRLKGPMVPINICFTEDNQIDLPAMRKYVNWLCDQAVPVLLLTYGSSEFAWQSEEDIRRLTAELADEISGRALFIASTNWGPPKVCRTFLQHAEQSGVDAVKVQTNPWAIANTGIASHEVIVGYFDQIQDSSSIPLVLWCHPMAPYPVETVVELAKREQVVAMKNDQDPFDYYYDTIRATANENFAVFSGGLFRNFIYGYQVGSPAFLCPISPFRPDIALAFYETVVQRRFDDAWQMAFRYEEPWLKAACDLGWVQSLKSAFSLYGLFPNNHMVPPQPTHTHEQRQQVQDILERVFGPIEKVGI